MSFHISMDSLEDIHNVLMGTLVDDPDCSSAPRGKPIRELIAPSFTLMNPRNRLITSPIRNVNYGFGVGELCWYVRGDRDLETMLYYNKRMAQFSDDGVTINSAYGNRIFEKKLFDDWGLASQWEMCRDELVRDNDSRRAVMHINRASDLGKAVIYGSKDVPCTMSLQLLVRDRKLHMHVLMRSNDVVWGMPYDVFSFTCLQEMFLYLLQEVGVPVDDLGSYHHTAGSLHIYETHFEMAGQVSKEIQLRPDPMKPFTLEDIGWLADTYEPIIRSAVDDDSVAIENFIVPTTDLSVARDVDLSTLNWMIKMLLDHREKRVLERLNKEKDVNPT